MGAVRTSSEGERRAKVPAQAPSEDVIDGPSELRAHKGPKAAHQLLAF